MLKKSKIPYLRDVYMAFLVDGARRTELDGYPIIEEWMVCTEPPKEIIQWDRRRDIKECKGTTICFYCNDEGFVPVINNPKKYLEYLSSFDSVIGLDASPYDNMPLVVQKSQIYLNISTTYYFGKNGIKVMPNIRLGDDRTLTSLQAYPKHTLISVGTNGFIKTLKNREIFRQQIERVVDVLEPVGICVYGPEIESIFEYAIKKKIPIYQYDSYTMKENQKDKLSSKGVNDER